VSPLAREIIEKLNKEEDPRVLAEVLDFYEYLKQKKLKELQKKWTEIHEDEPTEDEVKIFQEYKNSKEELLPLDDLIKELNTDAE
jgi:gentisate 1,2-dioxygenase